MTRKAPRRPRTGWETAGAVILVMSGATQVVFGLAALAGNAALEQNVQEIESNPSFGKLYLGLGAWGAVLIMVGGAQLGAARSLLKVRPGARLVALGATLFGLLAAFFTLAILHFGSVACVVLLLSAMYVLSYRIDD